MQYAPTLTDQKFDSLLSIESSARYVQGRMQYAPTHTDQKIDSSLSIESPTRYVLGRMQYAPTLTDQKIDSPLKPPTHNDPFSVYRCGAYCIRPTNAHNDRQMNRPPSTYLLNTY